MIPIEISNRHVHLSAGDLRVLFGPDATLHERRPISQRGQYAADEVVNLVGPAGKIEHVRVVGPIRTQTQVEVSGTDARVLGIDPPLRDSGELTGSASLTITNGNNQLDLTEGVIRQRRHIHASEDDCRAHGIKPGAVVQVRVNGYTFTNVFVKVHPSFVWRLHLDTDEALLAHLRGGEEGEVIL